MKKNQLTFLRKLIYAQKLADLYFLRMLLSNQEIEFSREQLKYFYKNISDKYIYFIININNTEWR